MNKYRTLLLNIGLFGINTVATKLITFLLVPLYTYYLSTKEFGITDMSLTVISLVLPIASMSISDAVLRFVIDDSNDQKKNDVVPTHFLLLLVFVLRCDARLLRWSPLQGL